MLGSVLDRVQETSATTGTGTLTLAGAVTGYQSFATAYPGASAVVFYCITNAAGAWEVGYGTYTLSGTTLSRTTITASSNSGSAVSFTGTLSVFNTLSAYALLSVINGGINAQTGTSYATGATDRGKLVTLSNSSAIAVSLAQAGSTGFDLSWWTSYKNLGNGVVTITPATSTINGLATLVLQRGDAAFVDSDGTNYSVVVVRAASRGKTALTDASSVTVDASLSDSFYLLATSGVGSTRALANPTNLVDGQVINFRYKQDGTGSRLLTFGTNYKFAGGTAPTASTAANAEDFMSCQYDATDGTLFCSYLKAFA